MVQGVLGIGLAGRLRRRGVRHLHVHFAHAPCTVGMYAAMTLGIPFSFVGHANDVFQRRELLREKLRRASFVAAISRWHERLYRRLCPGDSNPVLVRCGVEPGAAPRRRAGGGEVFRVLSVGRLIEKKGFDLLLRACADLRTHGSRPRLEVRIVGDGPLRRELAALTRALGLERHVTFLGPRPNAEVLREMRSADVFVLPCRRADTGDRDGIPVVLMEAMAAGTPVIAGDIPGIRDLVVHGKTGLLIDGKRKQSLVDAIESVRADRQLALRIGKNGRRWLKKEFSRDVNVRRLSDAIERAREARRT